MPSTDAWLQAAADDAERHALAGVRPILEALAAAVATLRRAPWNADASERPPAPDTAPRIPSRG